MRGSTISIAILAGGASKRFGSDKTFAKFRGMPLIKHLIWRFRKHTDDLFIVSRFDQPDRLQSVDIPIIYDSHVDRTIMGAVIDSIEASKNEWVFIIAVDFPLINWPIVNWISEGLEVQKDALFVLPKLRTGYQPLCALYRKGCLEILRHRLSKNQQRMQDICDEKNCLNLEVPKQFQWQFLNMNTVEDLITAEQLAESHQIRFTESVD